MSGGEQQRLAIARAIVNRPAILIADEPTANLDQTSARHILNVLRDFNRIGVTLLIASHDETLLARYATRTLRLEPGRFGEWPGVVPGRCLPAASTGAAAGRQEPSLLPEENIHA